MRKGPISGISWLQLIAGALAAMTSAWVASYLGVAGTIIGAAVGSLVASVASALYVRGLDHGTTLITESGSVVTRSKNGPGAEDEAEVVVADEDEAVTVDDPRRDFPWKRVLVWTGIGLATALVLIGGYELATDSSFGNSDNPTITRPFRDTGDSTPQERKDRPDPSVDPSDEAPTDRPTTPAPTVAPTTPAPAPTPTPEPAPEPAPEPTPEAPGPAVGDE